MNYSNPTPVIETQPIQLTEIPAAAHADMFKLLLLATVADLEVNAVELETLAKQCERLPFCDKAEFIRLCGPEGFFMRGELIERYLPTDALFTFARRLAKQLGSLEAKIEAIRVTSNILWADELDEREFEFIMTVGVGLGISRKTVLGILRATMLKSQVYDA